MSTVSGPDAVCFNHAVKLLREGWAVYLGSAMELAQPGNCRQTAFSEADNSFSQITANEKEETCELSTPLPF
jgi:hypothetical protein